MDFVQYYRNPDHKQQTAEKTQQIRLDMRCDVSAKKQR
ncbi:hypothetical protein SDC9_196570 [bioreactor metagenome]|uniref:Uncharacterized protein n=1 Tax=bioreactor metagenome TaxID=1076179 RepID=A0A645ICJ1_9ZZZZ